MYAERLHGSPLHWTSGSKLTVEKPSILTINLFESSPRSTHKIMVNLFYCVCKINCLTESSSTHLRCGGQSSWDRSDQQLKRLFAIVLTKHKDSALKHRYGTKTLHNCDVPRSRAWCLQQSLLQATQNSTFQDGKPP